MRLSGLLALAAALAATGDVTASANTVVMHVYCCSFSFNPAGQPVVNNITINNGDTVHWVWDQTSPDHSTTSVSGLAESWDSTIHAGPFTFDHTFTNLGTFPFYCRVHGGVNNGMVFGMSGSVTVQAPPQISTLKLAQSAVTGSCVPDTLTVTVTGTAPTAGQVVTLTNTNTAAVVPASVTIPAGASVVHIPVTTDLVTAIRTGTITATVNGSSLAVTLKVLPISVKTIVLTPNPVVGGATVSGSLTLYCPAAPGSITVYLSSSNSALAVPFPSPIQMSAGQVSATFSVNTAMVTTQAKVTIHARANGITRSKTLVLNP